MGNSMVWPSHWLQLNPFFTEIERPLESNYGIYFLIENSHIPQSSAVSRNLLSPNWDDIFSVSLPDELSSVNVRVYVKNIDTDAEQELDQFSIPANKVKAELGTSKNYIDSVITSSGNQYTYLIRHQSDGIIKIK